MAGSDEDRYVTVQGSGPQALARARVLLEEAGFRVSLETTSATATVGTDQAASGRLTELDDLLRADDRLGRPAALLLVNIDHFKRVRAMLGDTVADDILAEVRARLCAISAADADVAASGGAAPHVHHVDGDEFAILLPAVESRDAAARFAHEVLREISRPYETIAPQIYLTARVGIALAPGDGQDAPTLLRHAGSVVHHEARQGRNTVRFYTHGMADTATERFELEAELGRAIRNDELEVHYQPQLSLTTGEIIGAEALVRWRRPGAGAVPAEVFVAVAEDLGLIADLGSWVLTTAAAECRRWQSMGLGPLQVSINTSAYQFRRLHMADVVRQALEKSGLDPRHLMLEVTESLVLADVDRTLGALATLRRMGVRIALDDFGTGYSSMSYLKSFSLDCLKLDRSFVRGLPDDRGDLAVTKAVIRMAKSLNLGVTAEGVETEAQRDCLARLGCDHYQGYLASPPVPAEEFRDIVAARIGLS